MPPKPEPPGCRNAAIAAGVLVAVCVAFIAIGLPLLDDPGCAGGCRTMASALLFAGCPISALLNVVIGGEDLVVAWPLEITFWVIMGFVLARFADNRGRNVLGAVLVVLLIALAYGLVLSFQVEIDISG